MLTITKEDLDFKYKTIEEDIREEAKHRTKKEVVDALVRYALENAKYERNLDFLMYENDDLKREIKRLKEAPKPKHAGGRPKETDRLQEQAAKIQELLIQGMTTEQIVKQLNISRATFFRLKKTIKEDSYGSNNDS